MQKTFVKDWERERLRTVFIDYILIRGNRPTNRPNSANWSKHSQAQLSLNRDRVGIAMTPLPSWQGSLLGRSDPDPPSTIDGDLVVLRNAISPIPFIRRENETENREIVMKLRLSNPWWNANREAMDGETELVKSRWTRNLCETNECEILFWVRPNFGNQRLGYEKQLFILIFRSK